ncbi:MAG: MFS transporter [Candidatus Dormibacteria bacterium]
MIAAGLFLAALDTYVVVTVLPRIATDIGLGLDRPEQASPVISGFLLGYIVTMPLLGAVSDAYGRGWVYFGSLLIFTIGSVITATAGLTTSSDGSSYGLAWLISGRVLQGLGGGALVPVAMALAADLYTSGHRAQALGAVAALQETGSVVGPLYGALVAAAAAGFGGWRVIFWINVPLAALCAAGVLLVMRTPGGVRLLGRRHLDGAPRPRIDWAGGVLLGVGLALGVLALYPDDPSRSAVGPLFLPLGVASLVVLMTFAWQQAWRPDSLIPAALLRDRGFVGATVTNLLVGAGLMVALVDIPVFAQGVFDLKELPSALLLAQFMLAIPVGALAGGWLAGRAGHRATATAGLVIAGVAFLEMSTWNSAELGRRVFGVPPTTVTLLLLGLGFGLVIAPLAAAILDRSGRQEHGLASSLVVLARMVGMLAALSALAAFGIRRFNQLAATGPPIPIGGDAALIEAAIKARVSLALTSEYHEIFAIAAGLCGVAAVVALLSLSRPRPAAPAAVRAPA